MAHTYFVHLAFLAFHSMKCDKSGTLLTPLESSSLEEDEIMKTAKSCWGLVMGEQLVVTGSLRVACVPHFMAPCFDSFFSLSSRSCVNIVDMT